MMPQVRDDHRATHARGRFSIGAQCAHRTLEYERVGRRQVDEIDGVHEYGLDPRGLALVPESLDRRFRHVGMFPAARIGDEHLDGIAAAEERNVDGFVEST